MKNISKTVVGVITLVGGITQVYAVGGTDNPSVAQHQNRNSSPSQQSVNHSFISKNDNNKSFSDSIHVESGKTLKINLKHYFEGKNKNIEEITITGGGQVIFENFMPKGKTLKNISVNGSITVRLDKAKLNVGDVVLAKNTALGGEGSIVGRVTSSGNVFTGKSNDFADWTKDASGNFTDKDKTGHKLTIDQYKAQQGAKITICAKYGGDNSKSDTLIINKSISGKSQLVVPNANGKGAKTTQGIPLIKYNGKQNLSDNFIYEDKSGLEDVSYYLDVNGKNIHLKSKSDWEGNKTQAMQVQNGQNMPSSTKPNRSQEQSPDIIPSTTSKPEHSPKSPSTINYVGLYKDAIQVKAEGSPPKPPRHSKDKNSSVSDSPGKSADGGVKKARHSGNSGDSATDITVSMVEVEPGSAPIARPRSIKLKNPPQVLPVIKEAPHTDEIAKGVDVISEENVSKYDVERGILVPQFFDVEPIFIDDEVFKNTNALGPANSNFAKNIHDETTEIIKEINQLGRVEPVRSFEEILVEDNYEKKPLGTDKTILSFEEILVEDNSEKKQLGTDKTILSFEDIIFEDNSEKKPIGTNKPILSFEDIVFEDNSEKKPIGTNKPILLTEKTLIEDNSNINHPAVLKQPVLVAKKKSAVDNSGQQKAMPVNDRPSGIPDRFFKLLKDETSFTPGDGIDGLPDNKHTNADDSRALVRYKGYQEEAKDKNKVSEHEKSLGTKVPNTAPEHKKSLVSASGASDSPPDQDLRDMQYRLKVITGEIKPTLNDTMPITSAPGNQNDSQALVKYQGKLDITNLGDTPALVQHKGTHGKAELDALPALVNYLAETRQDDLMTLVNHPGEANSDESLAVVRCQGHQAATNSENLAAEIPQSSGRKNVAYASLSDKEKLYLITKFQNDMVDPLDLSKYELKRTNLGKSQAKINDEGLQKTTLPDDSKALVLYQGKTGHSASSDTKPSQGDDEQHNHPLHASPNDHAGSSVQGDNEQHNNAFHASFNDHADSSAQAEDEPHIDDRFTLFDDQADSLVQGDNIPDNYGLSTGNNNDLRLQRAGAPAAVRARSELRPQAGIYAANMAAANTLFATRMHDRIGAPAFPSAFDSADGGHPSLWLRIAGGQNGARMLDGALSTRTNTQKVQLGGEMFHSSHNGLDGLHFGAMLGAGKGRSHSHIIKGKSVKGGLDGYSAGIYGTWYSNDSTHEGSYLDGSLNYNWFGNYVENGSSANKSAARESYRSRGFVGAIEAGYALRLFTGSAFDIYLQPQMQITWMGVNAQDHKDRIGDRVSMLGNNNIQTRLGSRLYMRGYASLDEGKQRMFQPYVETNWLHNTKDFGVCLGRDKYALQGARDIGEIKIGNEGQINEYLAVWGNIGQQVGAKGYHDTLGTLGVKVNF